jgi:chitin disaccharide deacetylase
MDFSRSSVIGRRGLTLLTIALLAFACQATAKPSAAVLRSHEAFHKALRDADVPELEHLLDSQFVWTHADGPVQSKSDLLKQVRDGKLRYAELGTNQASFSEYRNAAVVTGHSEQRLADSSKPSELRYTLTLVKVGRAWKVVAYHTTLLAPGFERPLQVRLGYPADAKLLILNADDLAVAHSEDVASFAALDNKFVTSATVMVPCPWFTEVAAYAKAHPGNDLGLHLTLTSEWQTYRWGPVSPRAFVPSLVGPDGYFYSNSQEFAKHAKLDEVEIEIRAQIERAKSMGLEPSHLDAHMHSLYSTPELFKVLLKVAHEYKLPVRMARNIQPFQAALALMSPGDPVPDAIFSPGGDVPASGWKDYYVNVLSNLQPGVTEIFVHLAHDDAESQAIMVDHPDWGAAWRQREFDVVSSREFRKALDDNHIVLIGWRDIQRIM